MKSQPKWRRTHQHACAFRIPNFPHLCRYCVINPTFACVQYVCACVWWMRLPYRQQMTALQDNAKSRKAWRSSKDSAYFNVWPSMMSASSFSFLKESPREEQWAVSVARVACKETKTQREGFVFFNISSALSSSQLLYMPTNILVLMMMYQAMLLAFGENQTSKPEPHH